MSKVEELRERRRKAAGYLCPADLIDDAIDLAAELEAEVESLRNNAELYEWLRDNWSRLGKAPVVYNALHYNWSAIPRRRIVENGPQIGKPTMEAAIRAAIDASHEGGQQVSKRKEIPNGEAVAVVVVWAALALTAWFLYAA